jgi:hypothetical protein
MTLEAGVPIPVGLTFAESSVALLPEIVEALTALPLERAGGRGQFVLERIRDLADAGRVLYYRGLPIPTQSPLVLPVDAGARALRHAIRVCCQTPWCLRIGDRYCFSMADAAAHFLTSCYTRSAQVLEMVTSQKPPFHEPPRLHVDEATGYRFRWLRRRLDETEPMDFDGLTGCFDLSGPLAPYAPLLRAAEILHVGQKTAFGMGKVAVFGLE